MRTYETDNIDEIGGQIYSGVTVLAENPGDLEIIEFYVMMTIDDHLEQIEGMREIDRWWESSQENRPQYQDQKEEMRSSIENKAPSNLTLKEELLLSLFLSEDILRSSEEEECLKILVSVCQSGSELIYEADKPALCFYQGSLSMTITGYIAGKFLETLGRFAVSIFTGFILPSPQGKEIVKELRQKAREHSQFPDLHQLKELNSAEVKDKKGIIILLHGLFSTDVGTFDGFIESWNNQDLPQDLPSEILSSISKDCLRQALERTLKEDYLVVGWAHDTLFSSIEDNAQKLLEEIYRTVEIDDPPIIFVCHSRGGLVARQVTVNLQEQGGNWADKVKLCVTFGTPHKGAVLAESKWKKAAAVAAIANASHNLFSLSVGRILACCLLAAEKEGKSEIFSGIEDLNPRGDFLKKLCKEERHLAKPDLRKLHILAVGGNYQGQLKLWRNFMTSLLKTDKHDLIVEQDSTTPELGFSPSEQSEEIKTESNHFEYFNNSTSNKLVLKEVIKKISETLEIHNFMLCHLPDDCLQTNSGHTCPTIFPEVINGQRYVNVGGVRVPCRY